MSPCRLSVLQGFVFTSDQVCPEDSVVSASMVRSHISHGFGVYSHVFGVFPRVWYGPQTPDQNQAIMVSKTKIRIKELWSKVKIRINELFTGGQDQNKAITDHRPSK